MKTNIIYAIMALVVFSGSVQKRNKNLDMKLKITVK